MMRRVFFWLSDMTVDIVALMKQNPASAFAVFIFAYLFIMLFLIDRFFSTSPAWVTDFLVYSFLLLIGILGIITIRGKNAPLFAIPVRGKLAVLIGLFLAIVGFGLFTYGVIFEFVRGFISR